jgi:hypothetical protein
MVLLVVLECQNPVEEPAFPSEAVLRLDDAEILHLQDVVLLHRHHVDMVTLEMENVRIPICVVPNGDIVVLEKHIVAIRITEVFEDLELVVVETSGMVVVQTPIYAAPNGDIAEPVRITVKKPRLLKQNQQKLLFQSLIRQVILEALVAVETSGMAVVQTPIYAAPNGDTVELVPIIAMGTQSLNQVLVTMVAVEVLLSHPYLFLTLQMVIVRTLAM